MKGKGITTHTRFGPEKLISAFLVHSQSKLARLLLVGAWVQFRWTTRPAHKT